eukprot:4485612-Ditylum_brightwellii.AAC.1
MGILSSFPDLDCKHCHTTMDKFQFHSMARLDNTCHLLPLPSRYPWRLYQIDKGAPPIVN